MPLQFTENPQRSRSISFSSTARAVAMTPGVREATQAEAEAGAILGKYMSPLRTAQYLAGGSFSLGATDLTISSTTGEALLIGAETHLASLTGFHEENDYTRFALTDGTLALPHDTDQPPAVNMMRWVNPDGSAGANSSLVNYVFNTVWRPGTRVSTDSQAVYGLFAGASGQNLNNPAGANHSIIALGGKGSNAASTYIDTYGLLTLAYNFSTTALAVGAEFDVVNETGATVPTIQSGTLAGATIGLNILGTASGAGSANNSVGILVQSDTNGKFRTGFYFGTTPTEYGIDLRTVSGSAVPLLLPNNLGISSRNAADGADVDIIKLNSSNLVSLYGGQVTVSSAGATVVAGLLTGNLASAGNPSILANGRLRVGGIVGDTSAAIEFVPQGGSAAYLNLTTGNVWNFINASSVNQMSLNGGAMTLGTAGSLLGSLVLSGNTSGTLTVRGPAAAGSNTLTLPAGTTDFTATGGTGHVVKQASAGAAFTVGTVASSEIAWSGTSGGIPYYDSTTSIASSALLAANAIVVGGGAGTAPNTPATTPPTVSSSGVVNVVNATNATSVTTGALQVAGGMSAQLDVYGRQFYGVYDQNGQSFFQITNANAGANAQATMNATSDAGAIVISASSTARGGFAVVGATVPNGVYHDYTGTGSFAQFRIDSGFTSALRVTTTGITVMNALSIPAGGTAATGIQMSSTANFGIFFGSGAPSLSAAQGSLYLRSDGSGTTNRMYVNTDGSTTWTAVTTSA